MVIYIAGLLLLIAVILLAVYKRVDTFQASLITKTSTVKEFLEENAVEKKKIHFELFTAPGEAFKKLKPAAGEVTAKGPASHITVKLDGRSFEFDLPFNSDSTVLDAALQQGADLPYACKGGMCCTCKAKLVEGEVSMDVHWGLEEEEVENGYILTCQAHPKTEKVVVDFDDK